MPKSPYTYPRPGVSVMSDGRLQAMVWSPLAKKVELLPEKGAAIALKAAEMGFWEGRDLPLKTSDNYRIRLDGKDALPDPASLSQPEGVHGYSRVTDLGDYQWRDAAWRTPALQELIIYELHVGSFSQRGDFEGFEER